jgi:hypothetical protein
MALARYAWPAPAHGCCSRRPCALTSEARTQGDVEPGGQQGQEVLQRAQHREVQLVVERQVGQHRPQARLQFGVWPHEQGFEEDLDIGCIAFCVIPKQPRAGVMQRWHQTAGPNHGRGELIAFGHHLHHWNPGFIIR